LADDKLKRIHVEAKKRVESRILSQTIPIATSAYQFRLVLNKILFCRSNANAPLEFEELRARKERDRKRIEKKNLPFSNRSEVTRISKNMKEKSLRDRCMRGQISRQI